MGRSDDEKDERDEAVVPQYPIGSRRRRLVLDDPLTATAAEDRPESWGDRSSSEAQRLAEYRRNRPPHHGG